MTDDSTEPFSCQAVSICYLEENVALSRGALHRPVILFKYSL